MSAVPVSPQCAVGERTAGLDVIGIEMREQNPQGSVFQVFVENTQNTMVRGDGVLTITDDEGNVLASIKFEMATILAGDFASFYLNHPILLIDGDYLLHVSIEYEPLLGGSSRSVATINNIGPCHRRWRAEAGRRTDRRG